MSAKTQHTKRMLPILVILAVAILGLVFLRDHLSFEALAANREVLESYRDNNYLITAVGFIAAYVVIVAFSLPGATIATLTGGFLFGLYPGVFFNIIGAGLGDRMAARMDASTGRLNKLKQELDGAQWSILFVMRLVPAVPFFVANLLPALVGVPLYRFVVSTFFGIIPGAIVLTSVGAGLGSVFASGETPDLGIIFEPRILFPILGLAALSLLPIVIRRFRKDR